MTTEKKRATASRSARCGLVVFTFVCLNYSGCKEEDSSSAAVSHAETRKLWQEFLAANKAWLDPAVRAVSYHVDIEECRYHETMDDAEWRRLGHVDLTLDSDGRIQIVNELYGEDAPEITVFNGSEINTSGPHGSSSDDSRATRNRITLASRTATNFLSSVHKLNWLGLPDDAKLHLLNSQLYLLEVENLSELGRDEVGDPAYFSTYGVNPIAAGRFIAPSRVEIKIDGKTMRPLAVSEMSASGDVLAVIEFKSWLEMEGESMPKVVKCRLPDYKRHLTFDFTTTSGVWHLSEVEDIHDGGAISWRSRIGLNAETSE